MVNTDIDILTYRDKVQKTTRRCSAAPTILVFQLKAKLRQHRQLHNTKSPEGPTFLFFVSPPRLRENRRSQQYGQDGSTTWQLRAEVPTLRSLTPDADADAEVHKRGRNGTQERKKLCTTS